MLTLKAYAKVNLFIDVLFKRSDGYHQVEMVMQKLDSCDILHLQKAKGIKITCNDPKIPLDHNNLVHKAVTMLMADYPQITGVSVDLEKNIPAEAGLAGGSSDAAETIRGLSLLYDLHLSNEQMAAYGSRIGSDVSFFFYGSTCLATGRGEIIRELPELPPLYVVLLKPAQGLSTAAVYQNLVPGKQEGAGQRMVQAIIEKNVPLVMGSLYNKLEESSFQLMPALLEKKQKLLKDNLATLMSGSGSAFFSLFTNIEEAEQFLAKHAKNYQFSEITRCYVK